jgi:hypothetical protein
MVSYSKNKVPCMWEKGGQREGKRYAQLIAGKDGQYKRPLLINYNIYEETDEHALLPISVNNYVVDVERSEEGIDIKVFKVKDIENNQVVTSMTNHYFNGKWNQEPQMLLYDVIESALKKTKDKENCAPYYVML